MISLEVKQFIISPTDRFWPVVGRGGSESGGGVFPERFLKKRERVSLHCIFSRTRQLKLREDDQIFKRYLRILLTRELDKVKEG